MLSTLRTDNSPFNEQQIKQLQSSIGALNPAQSQWLSGYLAGRVSEVAGISQSPQASSTPDSILTILFGSETGNGEAVASSLAAKASLQGINTELVSLDNFRPAGLRKLKHVAFVMSTHGEGDPPDEALDLFEYLDGDRAPKLSGLNYRVLSLGDRSYQLFCEAGRRLDQRLKALGAKPFGERVDCDVDYNSDADGWNDEILGYASEQLVIDSVTQPVAHLSVVPDQPRWTRQQPFSAQVERIQRITANQSGKDVFHLELSLEDSGLNYQPGDALGVWAPNDPQLVASILEQISIDPCETVQLNDHQLTVGDALIEQLEITRLTSKTVTGYATAGNLTELNAMFAGLTTEQQRDFIEERQLADLAAEYAAPIEAQSLVDLLRPLGPRSYSIASSQQLVDEEVHLTVASLHSNAMGVQRNGVASQFLNNRLSSGDNVRVFLEPNRRFRLPEDKQAPIIMIAAGTGVAPYRAFMQELETNAGSAEQSPDSWLIFGNPHLRSDFLYQKEWLHWRETGLLNRIDTAWSRDQAEKHYVQNVVQEQAVRLNEWLQRGAYIYLCGSLQMGQSVQQALQTVIAEQRDLDEKTATDAMATLRREHRIQKDLY